LVGHLDAVSEVVDQVNQSLRVVQLHGEWGDQTGNVEDALHAVLGESAGEESLVEAVLGDDLGSRDEVFNVLLETNPVSALVVGVERLKGWEDAEKTELAHVLSRDNSQAENEGDSDFLHCN